jgi:dihydrofolate reductase
MKKIILYIAASLDQRIAESDGSLEWFTGVPNPQKTNSEYKDLLASVDTVLIGGRAYRELLNMDLIWPYQEQMTYVVSRHNWGDEDNIRFITDNIIENISALRNDPGKDILLVGGGELTSMLLAMDLIDEMQITYIPVILGKGIPLFPEQSKESKWELMASKAYNTFTQTLRPMGLLLKLDGVTRIAMESTDIYWLPVWNILEAMGFDLLLVNPSLIKQMPGRKSDVKAAQWIAIFVNSVATVVNI